jgi:hypothetical protein
MGANGPDFLCIGQQKAGSGWLYDQMQANTAVWMPPIKELNFFSNMLFRAKYAKWLRDYNRDHGPLWQHPLWNLRKAFKGERISGSARVRDSRFPELDAAFWSSYRGVLETRKYDPQWYLSVFRKAGELKSGDISPSYSTLDMERIGEVARLLPETRVVLFIRHPVDRFKSAFSMSIRKKLAKDGDQNDWKFLSDLLGKEAVARRSYPTRIWKNWSSAFGESKCRFWFIEDIRDQPGLCRAEVSRFVGVDEAAYEIDAGYNRKEKRRKVEWSDEIEARLADHFADEIAQSASLFGCHALKW